MLKNKKITDIQAFNIKSFLCRSKRSKRIKLNTNKQSYFRKCSLTYQGKYNLKKFFGETRYIS